MLRIRHVAVCTADPWGVEARVTELLQLAVVSRDKVNPRIGIRNGVFALQSTFLEITTPSGPTSATQRFLDRRGDGGYMVCLQVDDLASTKKHVADQGVRTVLSIDKHRAGDQLVSAIHLHPGDTGGTLFSFEEASPPDSWAYAGEAWRDYRRSHIVTDIVGVELRSRTPDELAARLGRLLAVEREDRRLALDGSCIRIVEGPGEHDCLHGIEFAATDRSRAGESHKIAGTVFKLV